MGKGGTEWLGEASEDAGFLFSVVHNAIGDRSELAVLDARDVGAGPILSIDLGPLTPWSVHGHWVPYSPDAALCPQE